MLDARICEKRLESLESNHNTGHVHDNDDECIMLFTYLGLGIDLSILKSMRESSTTTPTSSESQPDYRELQQNLDEYQRMKNRSWYLEGIEPESPQLDSDFDDEDDI